MLNKLVLVLNCGSSSIKFSILNSHTGKKYLFGLVECLYLKNSYIKWQIDNHMFEQALGDNADHIKAIAIMIKIIMSNSISKGINSIGHRIVHGGKKHTKSVLINDHVINSIKDAIPFAPLHNPSHLICIEEIRKKFAHLSDKNVAVFDTSFHQTMPESSYLYALPYYLYKNHGIRKYGAHGISHMYAMKQTALLLNKSENDLNIITCHLGNGSSITAIRNGISIDNSMGLTPLEGLVMGTRSGDIDPAIIFFLYSNLSMSMKKIYDLLTKRSGLMGLTETTSDFRYVEKYYNKKEKATRAMNVFSHRLTKYISAYASLMNGRLDALVFTGGIGENSIILRDITIKKLFFLGFVIKKEKNKNTILGQSGFINKNGTKPILVITSNEEIIIAKETFFLTN